MHGMSGTRARRLADDGCFGPVRALRRCRCLADRLVCLVQRPRHRSLRIIENHSRQPLAKPGDEGEEREEEECLPLFGLLELEQLALKREVDEQAKDRAQSTFSLCWPDDRWFGNSEGFCWVLVGLVRLSVVMGLRIRCGGASWPRLWPLVL